MCVVGRRSMVIIRNLIPVGNLKGRYESVLHTLAHFLVFDVEGG